MSRDGLSRAELGHLLSCEDALLASLLAALPRPPPLARLPPAALRLLLRGPLAPALRESAVAAHGGAPLLRWRDGAVRAVAAARYCAPEPSLRTVTRTRTRALTLTLALALTLTRRATAAPPPRRVGTAR